MNEKHILVTGAGGFIGNYLTQYLVEKGARVRGVDIKYPEFEPSPAHEFEILDLRRWNNCLQVTREVDEIYHLAANMGGIGFIETNKAVIMHDSALRGIHFTQLTTIGGFDSLGPWFMRWLPPASGIYNKIRKLAVINCCIVSQTAILSNPTTCTNLTQVDTPLVVIV